MNYLEISTCFIFLIVQSYFCHRKLCLNTVGKELINLIKVPKDLYARVCVCIVIVYALQCLSTGCKTLDQSVPFKVWFVFMNAQLRVLF